MKKILLAALSWSTLLLSGCLVPEKFDAKIDVNPDAGYSVRYTGTAAHAMAVMQMVTSKKPLSAKDEAALNQEAMKMAARPGVKKSTYVGDGRFAIDVEEVHKAGTPTNLLGMIQVSTDRDGVMTISSPQLSEKNRAELDSLGLHVDGKLNVTLPKSAEVISSNATSSPKFFGLFGAYSWKIGSLDKPLMMKIRFAK